MTANSFGLHVTTVSKAIYEVCKAIAYHLGWKYVSLPKDEMWKKVAEFEVKCGLVQAFGCIDGTHISIKRPTIN